MHHDESVIKSMEYCFSKISEFNKIIKKIDKNAIEVLHVDHECSGAAENRLTIQMDHITIRYDTEKDYLAFLQKYDDCKPTPIYEILMKHFRKSTSLKYIFLLGDDEDDYYDYINFRKVFKDFELPHTFYLFLKFRGNCSYFNAHKYLPMKDFDLYLWDLEEEYEGEEFFYHKSENSIPFSNKIIQYIYEKYQISVGEEYILADQF